MATNGLIFSKDRFCINCAKKLKEKEPKVLGSTCCATSRSDGDNSMDPVNSEPLDIRALDDQSDMKALPWRYGASRPKSIFRVRDRELALNLSIAGSECIWKKTQLRPTPGCQCYPRLQNKTAIQSISLDFDKPSCCASVRFDMSFTRDKKAYVSVRVTTISHKNSNKEKRAEEIPDTSDANSSKKFFVGLVMPEMRKVGDHIRVMDYIEVKCTNIKNPMDENDFITVRGSCAWKLYNDSDNIGEIPDDLGSPSPVNKQPQRATRSILLDDLQVARQKLEKDLILAKEDEQNFLDQFNVYTNKIKKILLSGSESEKDPIESPQTEVSDLRKLKINAWGSKEKMVERQKDLSSKISELEYLLELLLDACEENIDQLHVWCPQCDNTIQIYDH